MSIAQFSLAERSIAETQPRRRSGRTPATRLAVAQSDSAAVPATR